MGNAILFAMAVILAVGLGFLIPVLWELRKTAREATEFLKSTREDLRCTLKETEETMKNLRGITEDISGITGDARELSKSIAAVSGNVKGLADVVANTAEELSARVLGVRAGLKAAIEAILKNIVRKGG